MVRQFIGPRFTKARMGDSVSGRLLKYFGGPTLFARAKVTHTMAVYQRVSDERYFCIEQKPGAPCSLDDLWLLYFLRTFSDCIITTGKILRDEPEAFNPAPIHKFKIKPNVFFEKSKPVAILSNSLSENILEHGNALYNDRRFQKHLLSKPNNVERLLEHSPKVEEPWKHHNISLEPVQDLNLRKAISHL